MASTRRALAFSFLDRYAGLVFSILASMAIARLLTPQEVGVFSVTMVFLSLISCVRDLGAGQYLLQEKELTTDRIRATWAVQLGLGCLFAVVVLVAAWPLSLFYKEPRILHVMMVLAVNFAVNPFGSLTYAWLMREMRFDALAGMRFAGSLTGAIVSVTLAWRGFGPISLAIGSLSTTLANAALAVYFRPASFPWLPGTRELRRVLSFGGRVSITSIINAVGAGAADLMLGKLQGLAAAGLYSRGFGLASMFQKLVMDAVLSVALPLFSKANREQDDVPGAFLTVVSYVTVVGWPFMALLAIFSRQAILWLYGPQWVDSIVLTRWLTLGMGLLVPTFVCITALTACGAARNLLRTTLTTVGAEILIIGSGALLGVDQAAMAFAFAGAVTTTQWLLATHRVLAFDLRRLARVAGSSALVAAATGAVPLLLQAAVPEGTLHDVPRVILGTAGGVACFLATLFRLRHPLAGELRRAFGQIRWRRSAA